MVANVSLNPMQTTTATGSFNTSSAGFIQGTTLDSPAIRNSLAGGVLATSETLPLWGGCAISEAIPGVTGQFQNNLGGNINRAANLVQTAALGLTGFSVFDQDHSMVTTPQSPVPVALSAMGVNFYRLGSNARIAVKCDPALVALDGSIISSQVSWDFTGQQLVKYAPAYAQVTITGAAWSNTAGGQTNFTVGTDLTAVLAAGDTINVSGVVNTGGTSTSAFNGSFVVVSVPDSTHVVVTQVAAVSPGTYASGGVIIAGGGALACKVLDIQVGNSMTVQYDSVTGFATWNRSGTCAIILI